MGFIRHGFDIIFRYRSEFYSTDGRVVIDRCVSTGCNASTLFIRVIRGYKRPNRPSGVGDDRPWDPLEGK